MNSTSTLSALFVFSTLCYWIYGATILGVFHVPFYSHYQLGNKLLKELAARGHKVTVVTPHLEQNVSNNYQQISLADDYNFVRESRSHGFRQVKSNFIMNMLKLERFGYTLAKAALMHPNVHQLLKSEQSFDVVILHQFVNDAFKGFCYRFNAPCIVISPTEVPHWTHAQVANPDHPTYFTDIYSTPSREVYLSERISNFIIYLIIKLYVHKYALSRQNQLMHQYFPKAPHLSDLYYNVSLILTNYHASINPSLPHVPNMIDIAGYHINKPNELPSDIKSFLDGAKEGAILFSLGSRLRSDDLPSEKHEVMLKVFSKLKQRVIWKFDDDRSLNQTSNVKAVRWLSQQDVLAHPNLKLFITHGGLLSIIEAVHYNVPILGIPILDDQPNNIIQAENAGFSIHLPLDKISEETFSETIKEMLYNPQYSRNIKTKSDIMRAQPLKPIDKAVYWVEYVIRHQGAPHLRTAALNFAWYRDLLLDVVCVIALALLTLFYSTYKITKAILVIAFKKTPKKNEIKKMQ